MSTRRRFLATLGAGVVVLFAPRARADVAARGASSPIRSAPPGRRKTFVLVFQRGAVDGLSMVPPINDAKYYEHRPSIAIPKSGDGAALPLDAIFGLHPSLAPLKKSWDGRKLAVVHAVGSPDQTRSHFDAQDFVESGTPGVKGTDDGWLNRLLVARPETTPSTLRAVALAPSLPRILSGSAASVAMSSLNDLNVPGGGMARDFEHMYAAAVDQATRGTASEAFDAMRSLKAIQAAPPASNATYPTSPLGKRLQNIAQLIHAQAGVEIAVTDCGGWDTHAGQGASKGQLAGRLDDLALSIDAFATDLGSRMDDVCLVTVTEFGRTVRENGTQGTDHGHGSVMLVLGGKVRGQNVYAKWRGLADDQLWQGRDVPVTTDHRDVFAEVLQSHVGQRDVSSVFPGFTPTRLGLFA